MTINRSIWPYVAGPPLMLLIPLVAMRFTPSVAWSAGDFVVAGGLLYAVAFGLRAVFAPSGGWPSRVAGVLMVGTLFMVVWANLAVGIIGEPANFANSPYHVLVLVAFAGSLLSRFKAQRMQWVVAFTACAHTLMAFVSVGLVEPGVRAEQWRTVLVFHGIAVFLYAIIWGLYRWSLRSPVQQPASGAYC